MRSLGVEVQLVNPLGFMKRRKNHRDHRKIIVIDGRTPVGIAYIGGYNPTLHNSKWNDFMVKMTGDIVPILQQDLDLTWDGRSQYGIIPYSDGFVLADAIGHSVIDPILQDLIRHAERRVIIESAYVWGPKITECLIDIASRVEVDIIVPLHRNNKNRYVPSEDFLDEMRRAGARIHKYNGHGGMTHVKAMLVDDIGVFGSHNFNAMMSGKLGEVSIATDNPPLVSQLETFLENDIKNSTLIQTPYFLDRKLR
jgi:phosphatidylserine/phosphatidylglycerophosphate/cardiolipin synthase-like enzyme